MRPSGSRPGIWPTTTRISAARSPTSSPRYARQAGPAFWCSIRAAWGRTAKATICAPVRSWPEFAAAIRWPRWAAGCPTRRAAASKRATPASSTRSGRGPRRRPRPRYREVPEHIFGAAAPVDARVSYAEPPRAGTCASRSMRPCGTCWRPSPRCCCSARTCTTLTAARSR